MNSNDSVLNQSTEDVTGSSIVQTIMTAINQLSALRMDGYIVTLDARGVTSTLSLTATYVPETIERRGRLLNALETLLRYGLDSTRLKPTSKECLLQFLGKLVGKSSQEVEDMLQASSSLILTQREQRCFSSKLGTVRVLRDGSLFVEGHNQLAMGWNACQRQISIFSPQRGAETQSFLDGQEYRQSPCLVQALEPFCNGCVGIARNTT